MKTVTGADGTTIAYEQSGRGPNLLLVHGSISNRLRWVAIRPRFEEHFTVTVMDRRGRGGSGDHPDYAIEREFEDIVAVLEALDRPVLLFGHSFGGLCALGAASLTDRLAGLMLYEPPILADGESFVPEELMTRLERMLAAGEREGIVETFMSEVLDMGAEQLAAFKKTPAWPGRVASAHTVIRETRAEEAFRLLPERVRGVTVPTALLVGSDSNALFKLSIKRLGAALPNARTVVLPGQQHVAMDTGPDLLVDAVTDFWKTIG